MKKAIIIILILLIIASLAVIGYLIYSQNKTGASNLIRSLSGAIEAPISLFPVGTTTSDTIATTSDQMATSTQAQSLGVPNQPELSQMNIASLAVITINKNLQTILADKNSGNIYSLDDQNNLKRLSNATLPAMGESYFGSDTSGWRAILRQEKNGQIFTNIGLLKVTSSTSTGPFELKISAWINPSALAVVPNGSKIAYLETQPGGGANLYTNDWNLKSAKKVWSSPLKEWVVNWPKDNLISLTSRASFDYPGVAYILDLKTNQSKTILSDVNGLMTNASPDGQRIIYSKSLLNSFSLYQYDLATGTSRLLDFNTLPSKCAWFDNDILYCAVPKTIPAGRYPDDWYQGKVIFSDNIWRIDLKQRTTLLVYPLKGNYDLINLVINKQTGWLYALDKSNSTLQAFTLSE